MKYEGSVETERANGGGGNRGGVVGTREWKECGGEEGAKKRGGDQMGRNIEEGRLLRR